MKTSVTHSPQVSPPQVSTADCEKVVSLLDLIVDGEATEADHTYFFTHVEKCKDCFGAHEKHQQLKNVLRDSIERKAVPSSLLSSIQTVIKATA